ncbi:hypothetical protein [Bifidobacterium tissieri]|uniref:Uncharacterized protein n=1 Tax=Bifidobacterium tissieri TaxID=1630162 RepID=A0A5M9ZXM0_9BIFI|nr:hypothetical protein [Bifidobacterium tissieri]KAA8828659.1 hypothetical protein EM849_11520 [Bifidobacterium tissieri]KAA8831602.1 hypothetical protein EMO89_02435 [Bifidobacterium tissieri]
MAEVYLPGCNLPTLSGRWLDRDGDQWDVNLPHRMAWRVTLRGERLTPNRAMILELAQISGFGPFIPVDVGTEPTL